MILYGMRTSIQTGIDTFWGKRFGESGMIRNGTASGFCKARAKLKPELFRWLSDEIVRRYEHAVGFPAWHGYTIFGIDGSTVCLPQEDAVRREFYSGHNDKTPVARISQLTELHTGAVLDVALESLQVSELELALDHLDRLQPGSVVVMDRGYPAGHLFAYCEHRQLHYVARVARNKFKLCEAFALAGDDLAETIVSMPHSKTSRRRMKAMGLPASDLRLRIIRVPLPDGKVDVLVTNLFDDTLTPHDFVELYRKRWQCETTYRYEKCWGGSEHFTGKTVHSVYQDFFASVLLFNLVALTATEADAKIDQSARSQPRFANRVHLISQVRAYVVQLVLGTPSACRRILNRIIDVAAKTTTAIRPNRGIFPRRRRKANTTNVVVLGTS